MAPRSAALGATAGDPPGPVGRPADDAARVRWSLTTGYARVLLCIAAEPRMRIRDMAVRTGLTERAVQGILARLVEDGAVRRRRHGRRNHYEIVAGYRLGPGDGGTLGRWITLMAQADGEGVDPRRPVR